jgi:hypothetical protein
MDARSSIAATSAGQVPGRTVTGLKRLDRESRDRRVAGFVAAKTPVLPTREQWAQLAGTSTTGIAKALNGSRRKRAPSQALIDLKVLLQDVADIATRIQWRSAAVERAGLEEIDRLAGLHWLKHESTIEKWRDRGGTAGLLLQMLTAYDRLITTILSNNNLG